MTVNESASEATSGATGQELTVAGSGKQPYTTESMSHIPGFSSEQVSSLMRLFSGMVKNEFDKRFTQLEAKMEERFARLENNLIQSIEYQGNTPSTPPSSVGTTHEPERQHSQEDHSDHYRPHQNVGIKPTNLQATDIGFFDPEYQDGTTGPVTSIGEYVLYRNVYVFVDRLYDVAYNHGDVTTKNLVQECLRGSTALMWYTLELTDLEKAGLRAADLHTWCDALISRFKMRTSVALATLTSELSTYGLRNLKQLSPRAWIQDMLHCAKAANINSMPNQLGLIWNKLHVDLRRDIPAPTENTSLGQFLEHIDEKTGIWQELADRPPMHQSQLIIRPSRYQPPAQRQRNPFQHQVMAGNQVTYQERDTWGYPQRPDRAPAYLAEGPDEGYALYDEEVEDPFAMPEYA